MLRGIFKPSKTKLEIKKLNKKIEELENLVNVKVSKNKLLEEIEIQKRFKEN